MMIWIGSFTLFSIFTIWLGWHYSRGIQNLRHFILSDQNVGQFALFSTIVASFVGGGVVMGSAQKSFQFGIAHTIALLGFALQIFLTGWWVAPRMAKFRHAISLGDIIARYYGKTPQVLTGLLWLSFCIGILTAQMSAMGNLISSLLGISRTMSISISAGIVIYYCYIGGIRAVLATDILQFVMLTIALGLVTFFGIQYIGGWDEFVAKIPPGHLDLTSHLSTTEIMVIFMSFLIGDALIPPVFQRLLMSKTVTVARKAYLWSGLFIIPICFLAFSHGLIAKIIAPTLPITDISALLVQKILPLGIGIIALLGFVSVIMSSADSYLNAAAGSFVNDVIQPLTSKTLSQQMALSFARWITVVLGIMSTFFAIAVQDILDILLHTYQFWGPTLVVPLLGILSKKIIPLWGFYTSVLLGGLTVVAWNTFDLENMTQISALISGISVNAFVYSCIYVMTRGCCAKMIREINYLSLPQDCK